MNELGDIWGWGERESFEVIVKSEGSIEKRTLEEQQRLGWTGASTRSRARTQAMEATALSQNSIQCLRRKPRAGPLSRSLLLPPYHTCVGRKGPWYKNYQGDGRARWILPPTRMAKIFLFRLAIPSVDKNVEQLEFSLVAGGDTLWKTIRQYLLKLNIVSTL